ncbi:MAG TPA: hypothetical protein VGS05_15680 [Candidatus Sulfotelmatobacter sp.]|nr:hypothetical protein [Candidatus Sulfotelmatobacter sp.]
MRFLIAILFLCGTVAAQQAAAPPPPPKSVTVPAAIDHNRVVIDADILLPNNSWQTIHAWVDNGNPDLYLSRRVATLLGLAVTCGDQECSAPPPRQIAVGGMLIPLTGINQAKIPLRPVNSATVLAPGMNVEINLPASLLRHYDVLVDFPDHKFSIGLPGTLRFYGSSGKVTVNPENGLIQVPSKIENKKYNLALDLGSCISFLGEDAFDALTAAHPDWPHMTGAVGSANMWGADAEAKWRIMRLARVQFGPLFLTDVPAVDLPKSVLDFFSQRAAMPTAGLIGSDVLLNYRVGLDYAHSLVYFDIGRTFEAPEFAVVGLVLRPEVDGRYTILGVADIDGKPSLPTGPDGVQPGDHLEAVNGIPVQGATMGQIWSMLRGNPGQQRRLTIERAGKQFTVPATVQQFLPETPGDQKKRK